MFLVIYLVFINIMTFIVYGIDKYKARNDERRISEKFLIALAVFFCGSVGAGLGMLIWHHKIRKPRFYITVPVFICLHILLGIWALYQNYHLVTTEYDVDIGLGHDVTIVQISDLHNQLFGIGEEALLSRIEECHPDIIVVTGDLIDSRHTSYSIAEDFMEGAVKIAPVYYVTGNHERRLDRYDFYNFEEQIRKAGVIILDDDFVTINGLILAGIADASLSSFDAYSPFYNADKVVLLAHRPEYSSLYRSLKADLVLTGHIHGGQIVIPGKGGLLSPDISFFYEYYGGIYDLGNTQMIVSRGLGNSSLPIRINNYPEIVVVHVH